jgi:hypothetical protein
MSIEAVIARIGEIEAAIAPPRPEPVAPAPTRPFTQDLGRATSGVPAALTAALPGASALTPMAPVTALTPTAATIAPGAGATVGARMVALAQAEVGQTEQPPGSNDSPRIAEYRKATAGSGVGPWCNYFVSHLAQQAGAPLGEAGQGFGLVDATYAWAQRTGRANPIDSGRPPQPGDLIVWDEHIGMVEQVLPDGRIQTIEGNSSNAVTRRVHDARGDGALGFVTMS